ncbi:MAG: MBL fold metallo-hydrolase [Paludibacteraceae bacterium]|nr:MBL fold metallo-hydrolase [Paludibacteraceae bacterium]
MKMKTLLITFGILLLLAAIACAVLCHPAFGLLRKHTTNVEQSANWRNGQFRNQVPTPQFTGNTSMVLTMWKFLTERGNSRFPSDTIRALKTDLNSIPTDSDWTVWFGHSSYLFCVGGMRVLVDPVLKLEFPASLMLKPFAGTDIYRPEDIPDIDLLIITHEHWDHMDYATLRDIRQRVKRVVCPLGIADYLIHWGYQPDIIFELDWYDVCQPISPMTVTCLPSRHFSNRLITRNQTLWASFMVENNGRKVYVGGDGGYDKRFSEIRENFGQVDLAFLENGQYNDNWAFIHTTPADLEKVIIDLDAKQVFTVHHDKFALAQHAWNEPDSVAHSIAAKHTINLLDQPIGTVVKF